MNILNFHWIYIFSLIQYTFSGNFYFFKTNCFFLNIFSIQEPISLFKNLVCFMNSCLSKYPSWTWISSISKHMIISFWKDQQSLYPKLFFFKFSTSYFFWDYQLHFGIISSTIMSKRKQSATGTTMESIIILLHPKLW